MNGDVRRLFRYLYRVGRGFYGRSVDSYARSLSAHVSKELQLARPLASHLSYVQIEPSTYCNLACASCIRSHWDQPSRHLAVGDFRKILDRLPPVRTMNLVGIGEPLLNPSIAEIVAAGARKADEVWLVTNGLRLTPNLVVELEKAGLALLILSIDQASCETPTSIHPVGLASKVLRNLKNIRRSSTLRGHMKYGAMVTIGPDNAPTLTEIAASFAQHGISWAHFDCQSSIERAFGGNGWFLGKPLIEISSFLQDLEDVIEALPKLGIVVSFGWRLRADLFSSISSKWLESALDANMVLGKKVECDLPWTAMYITCDGRVTPCCFVPDPSAMSMGNILTQDFREIWHGKAMVNLRTSIKKKIAPWYCRPCPCFPRDLGSE